MIEFIVKYWIEWLFGIILLGMSVIFKMLNRSIKENRAIKHGIKGMLHNEIIYRCKHFLIVKEITLDDLEELEYLYQPYRELGGNGTAKKMMDRVYQLPIKKEE